MQRTFKLQEAAPLPRRYAAEVYARVFGADASGAGAVQGRLLPGIPSQRSVKARITMSNAPISPR